MTHRPGHDTATGPGDTPQSTVHDRVAQGMQVNQGGINTQVNNFYPRSRPEVSWPQRVGAVPTLASAFQIRADLTARIEAVRSGGVAVVLTQVLSGGGGVGKSQLAASYADQAVRAGVDLLIWVNAGRTDAVVTAYAQAAYRVQAPGADGSDAEVDARALLDWLATTNHSWLVVLDDITDPGHVENWWPASHTRNGWVLATTRLRDAALSGGGRAMVPVDVYTEAESDAYLTGRLTTAGTPHLLDDAAGPLAHALGHLPLALSHAAAYMINREVGCTGYLALFADRRSRLDQILPADGDAQPHGRPVAITLLLAVEAAQAAEPVGLALPALQLAAVLDPAGHPDALWTSSAVTAYLSSHRTPASGSESPSEAVAVTTIQARAAMRLLHRYGLATHDSHAGPRAVRIHALTARAARETTPPTDRFTVACAAADALLDAWPDPDTGPHLSDLLAALRTNTDSLASHAGDALWQPGIHPLLFRAGRSLLDSGPRVTAVAHWEHLATNSLRLLGIEHRDTLYAQSRLGESYREVRFPRFAGGLVTWRRWAQAER